MAKATIPDMLAELETGAYDELLDDIIGVLADRRRYVRDQKAAANKAALAVGTRVQVTEGISPKYLESMTGEITSRYGCKPGYIKMKFDWSVGRYRSGDEIKMPANCLEAI